MHIAMVSPGWPPEANANGIITYVDHMRKEYLRLGHRVSIFTGSLDAGRHDEDVWRIVSTSSLAQRVTSKLTKGRFGGLSWGHQIGRAINTVHAVTPIDVIEMEESSDGAPMFKPSVRCLSS